MSMCWDPVPDLARVEERTKKSADPSGVERVRILGTPLFYFPFSKPAASQPASQPVSQPASQPAT